MLSFIFLSSTDYQQPVKIPTVQYMIDFGKMDKFLHDFKRLFATIVRRSGVYKNVVLTVQGHADGIDINRRYNTVDKSDLIKAIDQFEGYLENFDHMVDQ